MIDTTHIYAQLRSWKNPIHLSEISIRLKFTEEHLNYAFYSLYKGNKIILSIPPYMNQNASFKKATQKSAMKTS